jgi:hypothetical protein
VALQHSVRIYQKPCFAKEQLKIFSFALIEVRFCCALNIVQVGKLRKLLLSLFLSSD